MLYDTAIPVYSIVVRNSYTIDCSNEESVAESHSLDRVNILLRINIISVILCDLQFIFDTCNKKLRYQFVEYLFRNFGKLPFGFQTAAVTVDSEMITVAAEKKSPLYPV